MTTFPYPCCLPTQGPWCGRGLQAPQQQPLNPSCQDQNADQAHPWHYQNLVRQVCQLT